MSASKRQFDAIVIGAGPGGYVCAIRLAQLGKKTAIVEKDSVGGVCLNVGCIPSKALIYTASLYYKIKNETEPLGILVPKADVDMRKMQAWKNDVVGKLTRGVSQLLKANGVELIKGDAILRGGGQLEINSDSGAESLVSPNIIIASGSRVIDISAVPRNGKNIISSTEALELNKIPERMIVIGGGFIGLEIGIIYAKLGCKVTVVEALDQLLPITDLELVGVVEKRMKKLGMTVLTKSKALGVKEKDPAKSGVLSLDVETMGGGLRTLEAEIILVSIGRRPNSDGLGLEQLGIALDDKKNIKTNSQCMTNVGGVYAIGDVTGTPQLAHRASMDGILVAEVISGKASHKDYRTVPWAVFCDPEIAGCGLSEKEVLEKGLPYRVGRFPFAASGRALSTNDTEGFVKVLINDKDESILGVGIVGPEASNLIAEATLAIEMGATAEDIVRTIHTHPTLPEAFPEALEQAYGRALHIYKPTLRR